MTWESERPSLVSIGLESIVGDGNEADGDEVTELRLEHRMFARDADQFKPFDWDAALERLDRALRKDR